jgi:sensor domain CHASE-containing protein
MTELASTDNVRRSWLLEKTVALLQIVILVVVAVIWNDLREVRDSTIKQGTKQERLIADVQNVEYNVRSLDSTVQRLVGQKENNHGG